MRLFDFCWFAPSLFLCASIASADDRIFKAHPDKSVLITASPPEELRNLILSATNAASHATVRSLFDTAGLTAPNILPFELFTVAKTIMEPHTGLLVSSMDSASLVLAPLYQLPGLRFYVLAPSVSLQTVNFSLADGSVVGDGPDYVLGTGPNCVVLTNGLVESRLEVVLRPGGAGADQVPLIFQEAGIEVGQYRDLNVGTLAKFRSVSVGHVLSATVLLDASNQTLPSILPDPKVYRVRQTVKFVDVMPEPLVVAPEQPLTETEQDPVAVDSVAGEPLNLTRAAIKTIEQQMTAPGTTDLSKPLKHGAGHWV